MACLNKRKSSCIHLQLLLFYYEDNKYPFYFLQHFLFVHVSSPLRKFVAIHHAACVGNQQQLAIVRGNIFRLRLADVKVDEARERTVPAVRRHGVLEIFGVALPGVDIKECEVDEIVVRADALIEVALDEGGGGIDLVVDDLEVRVQQAKAFAKGEPRRVHIPFFVVGDAEDLHGQLDRALHFQCVGIQHRQPVAVRRVVANDQLVRLAVIGQIVGMVEPEGAACLHDLMGLYIDLCHAHLVVLLLGGAVAVHECLIEVFFAVRAAALCLVQAREGRGNTEELGRLGGEVILTFFGKGKLFHSGFSLY